MSKAVKKAKFGFPIPGIYIHPHYQDLFDPAELTSFDAYLNQNGESIKSETRTQIRKVTVEGTAYAIKVYRYPQLTGFRTWHFASKAQREYHALARCESLNVNALKPVGYSVSRNRLGFIKECCLMTQWEDDKLTFRDWLTDVYQKRPEEKADQLRDYLFEIGRQLKILHENHVFLLTPFTKNIFVSAGTVQFLDVPYTRELIPLPAAIWGQIKDLGALFTSTRKTIDHDTFHAFFDGYGEDPYPHPNRTLQDKAIQGRRSHLKRTPFQFIVRLIRRGKGAKDLIQSD